MRLRRPNERTGLLNAPLPFAVADPLGSPSTIMNTSAPALAVPWTVTDELTYEGLGGAVKLGGVRTVTERELLTAIGP